MAMVLYYSNQLSAVHRNIINNTTPIVMASDLVNHLSVNGILIIGNHLKFDVNAHKMPSAACNRQT